MQVIFISFLLIATTSCFNHQQVLHNHQQKYQYLFQSTHAKVISPATTYVSSTSLSSTSISIPSSLTKKRSQTQLDCPHFNSCPGCIVKQSYDDVPVIQSAKLYFKKYNNREHTHNEYDNNDDEFYQVVIPSNIQSYRTQAKLVVRSKSRWGNDGCLFGLYERKSHDVVEIPNCRIHHPAINQAVDVLYKATQEVRTHAYNEENHNGGGLRYVQLQVERNTNKVCMTLIWNGESLKECQPDLSRLTKACKRIDPKLFHSIWCHTNASIGNSIFLRNEKCWHPMDGPDFVREVLPGSSEDDIKNRKSGLLHFTPMAFRQGNLDGFDAIALHVAKEVPPGSKVCELYAGVGILGLTALSYHAKNNSNEYSVDENGGELGWLRCSDENPANPRCFQKNVNSMPSEITGRIPISKRKSYSNKSSRKKKKSEKTLEDVMQEMMLEEGNSGRAASESSIDPRKGKVSYKVASAAKALYEGQALGADVLIVDPPRKGLEEDVLVQLCKPHNPNQDYTEDPVLLQGPRYKSNFVNDAHTLIYVSCGFDAFARDCDRLLKGNAGWRLQSATGYVLFPGSNHVETIAIFKRRAGRQDIF